MNQVEDFKGGLNSLLVTDKIKKYSVSNSLFQFFKSLSRNKLINRNKKIINSSFRMFNMLNSKRYSNYIMRHGLKLKTLKCLNEGLMDFFIFYVFFNIKSKSVNATHPSFSSNNLSIDFNFLLSEIILLLRPFFYLKTKKLEKKFKKKLKKKFTTNVVYIKPANRNTLSIKALAYSLKLYPDFDLRTRICRSIMDCYVEKKNSYLYKRKLYMYSKILNKNNQ